MAGISITKNAILSFSKSSEMAAQSSPLRPRVSRVCFTSASRHQQGQNEAEDFGNDLREYMDKAKEKTQEMKDRSKDTTEETSDAAKSKAEQINEMSKEKLGSMADKAYEVREKMAEKTKEQAEKTKEYVQGAKETTKGAAEKVADAAKQTVQKIKETVVGKSADDYTREEGKRVLDEQRRRQDEKKL